MRRLSIVAAVAVAAAVLPLAGIAGAQAAKFHSTSSSVANNGALVVSWDQRGLGHGDVDYELTADATATFACINRGGKNPSAANKRSVEQTVSAAGTFETRNGRIRASLNTGPPSPGDFTCPGGQRRVLADVSYTNIVLTDTTNDVSADIPDAERVFFAV